MAELEPKFRPPKCQPSSDVSRIWPPGREGGEDLLLLTTQWDTGIKVGLWRAASYQNKVRHFKK